MFYAKTDKLPKEKRRHHNLREFLDEFMSENIKIAKLHFTEDDYPSAKRARDCLAQSARNGGYPISVHLRNGEVFLVRKDI